MCVHIESWKTQRPPFKDSSQWHWRKSSRMSQLVHFGWQSKTLTRTLRSCISVCRCVSFSIHQSYVADWRALWLQSWKKKEDSTSWRPYWSFGLFLLPKLNLLIRPTQPQRWDGSVSNSDFIHWFWQENVIDMSCCFSFSTSDSFLPADWIGRRRFSDFQR